MCIILVVEDELLVRRETVQTLTDAGFRVLEASNAAEALCLLGNGNTVRAIVTDVVLPGAANGYWLAWRVRATRPDVALVVLSGRVAPGPSSLPPDTRFLSKPVGAARLLAELRGVIGAMADTDRPRRTPSSQEHSEKSLRKLIPSTPAITAGVGPLGLPAVNASRSGEPS